MTDADTERVAVMLFPAKKPFDSQLSQSEITALRKIRFSDLATPVKDLIRRVGGTVVDDNWLTSTITVDLPKSAVVIVQAHLLVESVTATNLIELENS